MAEPLHTRKMGNSLAVWAISVVVAVLIFCGIGVFLNSHGEVRRHPRVGKITHSIPVGGEIQDGVFRSSPPDAAVNISRWRI